VGDCGLLVFAGRVGCLGILGRLAMGLSVGCIIVCGGGHVLLGICKGRVLCVIHGCGHDNILQGRSGSLGYWLWGGGGLNG
jgi:hypothetical protein